MKVNKLGKTEDYVYDISLDGTVVNALGLNVMSNTDGFNFQMPKEDQFRYTEEHPYISTGGGRNSIKDKKYVGVDADVCEFEDLYFFKPWNGGVNKMGLGIDEYCDATINFSRKNYADKLENGKKKLVGNTIKSRKMSGYIEKFLDPAISMLLDGDGQGFLEAYYKQIDDIFNYRIPLRDIASKGKIKKTISQYIADCNTLTKSGSKKSRQAWYELVIKEGMKVNLDDTIYFVNCGTRKSEGDVKRIVHQFIKNDMGEIVEMDSTTKREILKRECAKKGLEYKSLKTKEIKEFLKPFIVKEEDEILLNCKLVPQEIINADEDVLCTDEIEYNVIKYIEQFNSRIKPLLVCFSTDIRDKIIIKDPSDRPSFTKQECVLVNGQPNKETDQDRYEQLMTPERKEIDFWLSVGEVPPFVKECDIDWDKLVEEHIKIKQEEQNELFKAYDDEYKDILSTLTIDEIESFNEDGEIPKRLLDIVTLNASDMKFYFIELPTMTPSTGGNIFEDLSFTDVEMLSKGEDEYEKFVETYHE